MRVRLELDIDALEMNAGLPESMQLRDLCGYVMHRLGFGPPRASGRPRIQAVQIMNAVCISSNRRNTPIEGAVTNHIVATEDITKKIVVSIDPPKRRG